MNIKDAEELLKIRINSFIEENFKDAKKWSLETPYLSVRNHHFYEKMGFVKIGETEPNDDGFYLFLYEKLLENKWSR